MLRIKREIYKKIFGLTILLLLFCISGAVATAQKFRLDEAAVQHARRYEPIIAEAASRYDVDPRLLWVIAYLETRFNPLLVSRKGAQGMMQFMPDTARAFGLTNPYDPVAAIDSAAKYVRHLINRFGYRVDLVLAAYNSGENTVEAYLKGRKIEVSVKIINPKGIITGGIPPYRETKEYVADGLKLLEHLRGMKFLPVQSILTRGNTESGEIGLPNGSLVRKSIRASINSNMMGAEQRGTLKAMPRLSIYFGNQRNEK